MPLTAADIFQAARLREERVSIPEWGGAVILVRELTGEERDRYESESVDYDIDSRRVTPRPHRRAHLVQLAARDPETGARLFDPEDLERLSGLGAAGLSRVFECARRLSGLGPEVEDAAVKKSSPAGGEPAS